MRILTWNIQNSGVIDFKNPQRENIKNILCQIEELQADVVALQEFQYEYYDEIVKNGLEKMDYTYTVYSDNKEKNLRNRVLIAVKSKYSFYPCEYPKDIRKYSRRNWNEIIIQDKKIQDKKIAILSIDVPLAETTDMHGEKKDNRTEKKQFLEALKVKFEEYSNYDIPAMILGDFNLHEKAVYKEYLAIFNTYLSEITTETATCQNYKFDYIFVNSKMKKIIVDESRSIEPHHTDFSDHKYLYVDINEI